MSFICITLSFCHPVWKLVRAVALGVVLTSCLTYISILSASERTAWFSDVPLIDSVTVDAQLSFAFDAPSGRILVLHLLTQAADKDIQFSYRATLSALGWVHRDGQYFKGDELLKLEKLPLEGKPSWRLTIIPMSANQLKIR